MPHETSDIDIQEKKTKANPCIVIGIAVLFAVIGIVSMALAIDAYVKWKASADDLQGVIDNWKVQPIINITATNGTDCPSGWDQINGASYSSQQVQCQCSGQLYGSAPGYCEDFSAPADNCTDTWVTVDSVDLTYWVGGSKLCVQRGGPVAVDRTKDCGGGEKKLPRK